MVFSMRGRASKVSRVDVKAHFNWKAKVREAFVEAVKLNPEFQGLRAMVLRCLGCTSREVLFHFFCQ